MIRGSLCLGTGPAGNYTTGHAGSRWTGCSSGPTDADGYDAKRCLRLRHEADFRRGSPPGPWPTQPRLPELDFMTGELLCQQHIPKTLIQEAILNPPVSYWGPGSIRVRLKTSS